MMIVEGNVLGGDDVIGDDVIVDHDGSAIVITAREKP